MRKEYEAIKAELKARRGKATYFTLDFYRTYKNAVKAEDFSSVFSTAFYQKNGGGYCEFLEIAAAAV